MTWLWWFAGGFVAFPFLVILVVWIDELTKPFMAYKYKGERL